MHTFFFKLLWVIVLGVTFGGWQEGNLQSTVYDPALCPGTALDAACGSTNRVKLK